jgi:hypothetical protein
VRLPSFPIGPVNVRIPAFSLGESVEEKIFSDERVEDPERAARLEAEAEAKEAKRVEAYDRPVMAEAITPLDLAALPKLVLGIVGIAGKSVLKAGVVAGVKTLGKQAATREVGALAVASSAKEGAAAFQSVEGAAQGIALGGQKALVKAFGTKGTGYDVHHWVEQRLIDVFGPDAIHNTGNTEPILRYVHRMITAFYKRADPGVRAWMETQPFHVQQEVGKGIGAAAIIGEFFRWVQHGPK